MIHLVIIKNSSDQVFCHPGTNNPFVFDSFERAEKFIEQMNFSGVIPVELDNETTEERYGGQEDLW